jgi:hypothetical protein
MDEKLKGSQLQNSRQSAGNARSDGDGKGKAAAEKPTAGIGSSQGQDTPSRDERPAGERPSAGTADIERGGGEGRADAGGSQESLVQDSVGAYKERP